MGGVGLLLSALKLRHVFLLSCRRSRPNEPACGVAALRQGSGVAALRQGSGTGSEGGMEAARASSERGWRVRNTHPSDRWEEEQLLKETGGIRPHLIPAS